VQTKYLGKKYVVTVSYDVQKIPKKGFPMIQFTKLDGNPVLVNTDSIKHIEKSGDTIIHYLNGDTIMIKETIDELEQLIIDYRRKVLKLD